MRTTVKVTFEKNIQNNKTILLFLSLFHKHSCRKITLQQHRLKNVYPHSAEGI